MEETKRLMRSNQDDEDNIDLEDNFSDSTHVDGQYIARDNDGSSRKIQAFLTWSRWLVVVTLQTIIIIMVLLVWKQPMGTVSKETVSELQGKILETGDDVTGLFKTGSHSYEHLRFEPEKYFPNTSSNANRAEIRHNWDLLMPKGSGTVAVPDYREHPLLGNPITDDPLRKGPVFEASWTHAIHCLYYSVDTYHQLLVNGPSEADDPYHAAHCFEYLRTSIMCNLDMTLEGELSTPAESARGQPHVCRNREEAVNWIEERRVDDRQDVVGPTAVKEGDAGNGTEVL